MGLRHLAPFLILPWLLGGCFIVEAVPGGDELIDLVNDVSAELEDLSPLDAQHVFCRYSEVLEGRPSVRSGLGIDPDPVLCYDSGYYEWTVLLGGAALALCWDTPDPAAQSDVALYDADYNEDDGIVFGDFDPTAQTFSQQMTDFAENEYRLPPVADLAGSGTPPGRAGSSAAT